MSADVDKLLRAIYIQAELADDLEGFKAQLRGIIGEENVAVAVKQISHLLEAKNSKQ